MCGTMIIPNASLPLPKWLKRLACIRFAWSVARLSTTPCYFPDPSRQKIKANPLIHLLILMLHRLSLLFPLWMILSGAAALGWPERLTAVNHGSLVVLLLAFIMLCMGLTLTFEDFRRIARMPRAVGIGFAAQYSIMPLLAWSVAQALELPPHFAVGLILVGCVPAARLPIW